jgi:hypothetical protein
MNVFSSRSVYCQFLIVLIASVVPVALGQTEYSFRRTCSSVDVEKSNLDRAGSDGGYVVDPVLAENSGTFTLSRCIYEINDQGQLASYGTLFNSTADDGSSFSGFACSVDWNGQGCGDCMTCVVFG